jgi:hypothetical protein
MQRTNFSPIQHGFKFANTFVNHLANLPGFGKVETAGRCGGMSYTALDYYANHIPVPAAGSLPADGVPLADYIFRRQEESFLAPTAINFITWTLYADTPNWFAKGVHGWTVEDEFPRLRALLDQGIPQVLGLIAARDIQHIGYNHQVVACGYEFDPATGKITVLIYDCNSPNTEVTLTTGPGIAGVQSSNGYAWRGFFVQGYGKEAPDYLADQVLLREASSPTIYAICGGGKLPVPDMNEFNALGYQQSQVRVVPDGALNYIADFPGNGTLVKEHKKDGQYVIFGGTKFLIPTQPVFNALGFLPANVHTVPFGSLAKLPALPVDGTLLREMSAAEIYVMKNNSRHRVPNQQAFIAQGHTWGTVGVVPDGDLAFIPDGGAIV